MQLTDSLGKFIVPYYFLRVILFLRYLKEPFNPEGSDPASVAANH